MNILNWVIDAYSPFFQAKHWGILSNPTFWGIIAILVIMEGLLSVDNAITLALRVRHLPEQDQNKALRWGMIGAYVLRFLAIGAGTALTKLWWAKVAGGVYLLWLVAKFVLDKRKTEDANHDGVADVYQRGFWYGLVGTIIAVEGMDFVFSIDSILASIALSAEPVVILIGGMLGILAMRFVAGLFVKLLKKVPELETTAYILIFIIGAKLIASGFGYHVDELLFFSIIIVTFLATFVVNAVRRPKEAV